MDRVYIRSLGIRRREHGWLDEAEPAPSWTSNGLSR